MPKLCVISIYVSDLELAKQFYCGKLGFEVSREYDANTVSLKHEGIPIVLYQVEQPARLDYPQQAQVVLGLRRTTWPAPLPSSQPKGSRPSTIRRGHARREPTTPSGIRSAMSSSCWNSASSRPGNDPQPDCCHSGRGKR